MQDNTDNDTRWNEAVKAAAERLNKWVWSLWISLYRHGSGEYYTRLGTREKDVFLMLLDWVGNEGQDVPMNLSLEQFCQVIDVWWQLRTKYQNPAFPDPSEVSLFIFLNNVLGAEAVEAAHKRRLCHALLDATITYYALFGKEAAGALEYVVLRPVAESWTLRPVEDDFQCDLVINQLQNHCAYCRSVSGLMKNRFGPEVILKPTGGDFHNHGRTPLFVCDHGAEYVLKPRNMLEEQCIDRMVGLFNRIMPGLGLPVSRGIELIDAGGRERFALVRKYVRQKAMSRDQALAYYEKVGALLFMIKLFGIEDIHMENMMTTAAGPVILDGECLFCYNFLHKEDMHNGALGLLIDGFNEGLDVPGLSNNVCLRLNSTMQYAKVSRVCKCNRTELTEYGAAVVQGFQKMAAEIRKDDNRAAFAAEAYEIYREMVINQELRIRSVPVKTSEWKAAFYITAADLPRECHRLQELVKNAVPGNFEGVVGSDAEHYEWMADTEIDQLIEQSIRRGDVPFFYLEDVTVGVPARKKLGLMLEGEVICTVDLDRVSEGVRWVFDTNLYWLLSDEAVQSLQALLAK